MKCCKLCFTEQYFPKPLEEPNLLKFSKTFFATYGVLEDLNEKNRFCFECKSLLWKAYTLIQKAVCAQKALSAVQQMGKLPAKSWQNIRKQHGLFSKLGYHKVDIDYFINSNDNPEEEVEMEIGAIEIKDEVIKYESPTEMVDDLECNYTDASTDNTKQRKKKRRTKHKRDAHVKRKSLKKKVVVEKGPRPVDVTIDHIIEGKRKREKRPIDFDIVESETEAKREEDQKKKKRKRKKDENEMDYNPTSSGSDTDTSAEFYNSTTCRKLKEPKRIYPRPCDLCGAEVQTGNHHYKHYVLYHKETEYPYKKNKSFICDQCGKGFWCLSKLRDHRRTHGEKRTISCTDCDKIFFTNKIMRSHVLMVHAPKKFFCDFCGKGFSIKADIALHIRIHTGTKPYQCHICGLRYAHGGNRLSHIRNIHQGKQHSPEFAAMVNDVKKKRRKRKNNKETSDEDTADEGNKKKGKRSSNQKTRKGRKHNKTKRSNKEPNKKQKAKTFKELSDSSESDSNTLSYLKSLKGSIKGPEAEELPDLGSEIGLDKSTAGNEDTNLTAEVKSVHIQEPN